MSMEHCPHCGRPRRFPNVDVAESPNERNELIAKYDSIKAEANREGWIDKFKSFEEFIKSAKIVICRNYQDIRSTVSGDNIIIQNFYDRGTVNLASGSHVLKTTGLTNIRSTAETAFFGDHCKTKIHFAALSPDRLGLNSYGDCSITLKSEMIQHRTSFVIKNMLLFFKEVLPYYGKNNDIPPGFRANWDDRTLLCMVKLGKKLKNTTSEDDYSELLMKSTGKTVEDEFVEAHVFGMLTIRSFERVVMTKPPRGLRKSQIKAFSKDLDRHGVHWQKQSTTR